ncbi:MAG: hypothetical protein FWG51_04790 [Firmicutes bacterium]|nr:hypothetical protein [Bacillota bacterium]
MFTSNINCSVRFNEKNIGIIKDSPLFFEAPALERYIVEILPFCDFQNFCNACFLLSNTGSLDCKSGRVNITKFSADYYAVHFNCLPLLQNESRLICQFNYNEKNLAHCATVFYNGNLILNIESAMYVENYVLPNVVDVKLQQISIPDKCLLLSAKQNSKTYLKIAALKDDYTVFYDGFVLNFKIFENKLFLTESLGGHMGHCLEKVLSLSDSLKTESAEKNYIKNKDLNNIPPEILPYVFLESVKNGFLKEEKAILAENLQNADEEYFINFFGEIYDIMQNPKTHKPCIVKKLRDNCYLAVDYSFEFKNGKIYNIFKE